MEAMSTTWKHPQLGDFKYDSDEDGWAGQIELPAMKIFNWEDEEPSTGKYQLLFRNDDKKLPSDGAVRIALAVLANQANLPQMVTGILWDQFNGRGAKSDMWWYGDMQQVTENFGYDELPAPERPEDLAPVMNFLRVNIYEEKYDYKLPFADLNFTALFEEEHGLSILTDGKIILGTGYMHDATPTE
jgi:hypothetical protein